MPERDISPDIKRCPIHGERPASDRGWCRVPFGMGVSSCGERLVPVDSSILRSEHDAAIDRLHDALRWIATYGSNEGDLLEGHEDAMRNIARNTLAARCSSHLETEIEGLRAAVREHRDEAEAKKLRHLLRVLHDDPQPRHADCDICDALESDAS